MQRREWRELVPVEVAAVLALAIVPAIWPLPDAVPVAIPLFVAATASRWARGWSWGDVVRGPATYAGMGAIAGAAALIAALVVGTPIIEDLSQRAIEWSQFPLVRGSPERLAFVALHVAVTATTFELALRGWIVERVLELSPGPALMPVLVGAIAEGAVTPGDFAARSGAFLFGIGMGAMYVAGGRSVLAPICARATFAVGAVVLEGLRLVG